MRISIIHASRSRPAQAKQTVQAWLSAAKDRDQIEYILSIDSDDPTRAEYADIKVDTVLCYNNKSAIEAFNRGAAISKGNLLIAVSDDFGLPPFHWDNALLTLLEGNDDFVVKTDDGLQPWIITLPIMDRKFYNRFGYIYHPDYVHLFCDTELSSVGSMLDRTIYLPLRFPHQHYTTGKNRKDAISEKNDATWSQGEKVYLERLLRNFDLPDEDIKGVGNFHPTHLAWLKSKGIAFSNAG